MKCPYRDCDHEGNIRETWAHRIDEHDDVRPTFMKQSQPEGERTDD